MSPPILLAQVTDTHLLAKTTAQLRGCNPWQTFNTVLQTVAQCQPDGLLLTGDLAEQGELDAYEQLAEAISPLPMPTYWLPGNHDRLATLQQVFQQLPSSHGLAAVDLEPWQLILLDSVLPLAKFGEGYLSDQQLQTLHSQLSQHPDKPTLVALHHHPIPIGIDWVDQMQVQNAHDFLTLLNQFSNVKLVVFGHIHHEFQQHSGISFYGSPSTCLQVTSVEAGLTDKRPGFRLVWLYPDGTHKTEVRRIKIKPLLI